MDVFASLTREWSTLAHSPATRASYRRWRADEPLLQRWSSLDEVLDFARRRGDPGASDRVLAVFARRSSADELAARALLQALLPGLRAIVVQHHWLAEYDDLTASTVAFAWGRIRTYPYARRPQRIAANIIRDTAHQLRRAHRADPAITLADAWIPPAEDPAYKAIDLLDLAQRNIDSRGLALVLRTRVSGEEVSTVAAEIGCTAPALRERRRRAEEKLRTAVTRSMTDRRAS